MLHQTDLSGYCRYCFTALLVHLLFPSIVGTSGAKSVLCEVVHFDSNCRRSHSWPEGPATDRLCTGGTATDSVDAGAALIGAAAKKLKSSANPAYCSHTQNPMKAKSQLAFELIWLLLLT